MHQSENRSVEQCCNEEDASMQVAPCVTRKPAASTPAREYLFDAGLKQMIPLELCPSLLNFQHTISSRGLASDLGVRIINLLATQLQLASQMCERTMYLPRYIVILMIRMMMLVDMMLKISNPLQRNANCSMHLYRFGT